jgi:hypothetical protein
MHYLNSTATWTAALFAATGGIGYIVAFLSGTNPRSYVLIAAEAAATIGVVALLVSVIVVFFLTRRESGVNQTLRGSPGDQPAGDRVACLRKRREVLDERLNIDEPRLCSQYMIPCTSWSFCAGSDGEGSGREGTSPAAQKLVHVHNLLSETKDLPVVHRNGMDSCPFRFTSPLARSVSLDGVASNSSDFGTAPR